MIIGMVWWARRDLNSIERSDGPLLDPTIISRVL